MTITKEWALRILDAMPEPFSADDFINQLIISEKIELARAEVKNGEVLTEEEADKIVSTRPKES